MMAYIAPITVILASGYRGWNKVGSSSSEGEGVRGMGGVSGGPGADGGESEPVGEGGCDGECVGWRRE